MSTPYYSVVDEGRIWITKWFATFGLLTIAAYTGQLTWTTSAAIAIFVAWEGYLPYQSSSRYLSREMNHSLSFIAETENYSKGLAEELLRMSTANGSAALKLAVAVLRCEGRIGKKVSVDMFVDRMEIQIDKLITPVKNAAELATGLGMLGSMVGIAQALMAAGMTELQAAFKTMAITTIVGLAGMLLLVGLYARLKNAKKILLNELTMFGYLIAGIEKGKPSDADGLFTSEDGS